MSAGTVARKSNADTHKPNYWPCQVLSIDIIDLDVSLAAGISTTLLEVSFFLAA